MSVCSLERLEEVRTWDGKVIAGWGKSCNNLGIPFFMNHLCHQTQWDHPVLRDVLDGMFSYNSIKFTAYRTAVKLRSLQRVLKLHQVSLAVLTNILDQLPLQHNNMDMTLDCAELEELVGTLFNLASREKPNLTDMDLATELTWNFLLNFLDPKRTGVVRVLSVVVTLLVLCDGKLHQKYKYIFRRLVDHNNAMSRTKMAVLLNEVAAIPEFLSEKLSFGSALVPAAVDSCFRNHVGAIGIREESFFVWLLKEPQTLVWLSTFYRLNTAEQVSHNVKCSVCKMYPINGLRYQCLKCFHYDLCQHCFFNGQKNHGHKIKHPMQEYYAPATSREGIKAVMKQIGCKLHIRRNRTSYLPISPLDLDDCKQYIGEIDDVTTPKMVSQIMQTDDFPTEFCSRTVIKGTPVGSAFTSQQNELESIIVHLEDENRNLMQEIEKCNASPSSSNSEEGDTILKRHSQMIRQEMLEDFSQHLELQIYRLKRILKTYRQVQLERRPEHLGPLPRTARRPVSGIPKAQFSHISPIHTISQEEMAIVSPVVAGHMAATKSPPSASNKKHESLPSLLSSTAVSPRSKFSNSLRCLAQSYSNLDSPSSNDGSMSSDSFGLTTTSKFTLSGNETSSQLLSSVQIELDEILAHLKDIFPSTSPDSGSTEPGLQTKIHHSQLLKAAVDVGNVLSEMVQNITLQDLTIGHTSS